MKKLIKSLALLLCLLVSTVLVFASCDGGNNPGTSGNNSVSVSTSASDSTSSSAGTAELVDYVSQLKLDFSNGKKKQEVTVRLYVDGDTTHFNPVTNSKLTGYNAADFAETDGYIKARYLAVNTPENTGKIEPWGSKAAALTRSRLENAKTIIVESDTSAWDLDSTGERYTLWIWYLPNDGTEYRNLNLEILQEGLALGSSTANNSYGEICMNALSQAKANELYVFSKDKDPDFFYGEAIPVTLKELRCNVKDYAAKKVKVEGTITTKFSNSVYIEDFDPDTGVHFGMSVYYGFQLGAILEVLAVGNRVSVVGTVSYWEAAGTYQISGVSYDEFTPNLPSNSQVIETGVAPDFAELTAKNIVSGKLNVTYDIQDEEGNPETKTVTLNYGEAVMSTSATLKNLKVIDAYTTKTGDSKGAMSLTCQAEDGTTIVVRTEVLKDENNEVITQDKYLGKTITVKGVIDKYENAYQLKVYRADYITILG